MPDTGCRVSVIVPTYNRSGALDEHAAAVLAQDFDDYEVVYVDDGSTDGTPGVLANIQAAHPERVRTVRIENSGPGAARNAGAREATGELFLFTDDDVIVPKDWVSGMVSLYEAHGYDAVCGGVEPYALDTPAERYMYCRSRIHHRDKPKPIKAAPMMNFMVSRKMFERLGGFLDERVPAAEDWEFCLRLTANGGTIFYVPSISVLHRYQTEMAAVEKRIRATGWYGVYISSKLGRNLAWYTLGSTLRFAIYPFLLLRRYPLDLYWLALRMEGVFWWARVKAYRHFLAGRDLLKPP